MHQIVIRLNLLKKSLKKLQIQQLNCLLNEANLKREQLQLTLKQFQYAPLNVENQQHKKECQQRFKEASYLKEMHLQQQSMVG